MSRLVGRCPRCKAPAALDGDWLDGLAHPCRCGARFRLREVQGRRTAQPCDARCMGATGPDCECACGGANHGGRYLPPINLAHTPLFSS